MAEPARDDGNSLNLLGIPAKAQSAFVVEPEEFDVPPENWTAVRAMIGMQTQWRHGMAGRTGLAYEALPMVLRSLGVAHDDEPDVFAALQVMEIEMLRTWSAQK